MLDSEKETQLIKELEASEPPYLSHGPGVYMGGTAYIQHYTKISDAYWRRRRAWARENEKRKDD